MWAAARRRPSRRRSPASRAARSLTTMRMGMRCEGLRPKRWHGVGAGLLMQSMPSIAHHDPPLLPCRYWEGLSPALDRRAELAAAGVHVDAAPDPHRRRHAV